MTKVRVAVVGTIGKSITFDPDATVGAQIGINLALPDGTIPSLAELAAAIVAAGDDGIVSAITAGVGSETILETQIADGAILARVASAESITEPWTFDTDIKVTEGDYTTLYGERTITVAHDVSGNASFDLSLQVETPASEDSAIRFHRLTDADVVDVLFLRGDNTTSVFAKFEYDNSANLGVLELANNTLLRILDTTDASLSSTQHGFQSGPTGGANLIIDTNEIIARNDSAAATLFLNAGSGQINLGSTVRVRPAAGVTGQTSTATVQDHAGVARDIGFNILPTFNVDTSDTLEANHCGKMNLKTTNTGRTLTAEASTSTDFPVGGVTTMLNWGTSGNYAFTEGTGTTIWIVTPGTGAVDSDGGFSLQPGGFCTIWRFSNTAYYCWGAELN